MKESPGNLVSVPEAAAKLGLKPSTIRKMIMQRRIEVFRPTPRSVRISERTIEAILAKGFRPAISA
jgi:excisionase family DNA binding protein